MGAANAAGNRASAAQFHKAACGGFLKPIAIRLQAFIRLIAIVRPI